MLMAGLNRSCTETRSSFLDTLFLDLKTLARSVRQEVLPEFSSVLKQRPELLVDPRIFLDELPEDPGKALPVLKVRASTPSGKARPGRLPLPSTALALKSPFTSASKKQLSPSTEKHKETVVRCASEASSKAQRRIHLQELAAEQQRIQLYRILEQTGALDRYKPDKVRLQLRQKAVREDFRANIVRLTKVEICQSRKNKHLEVLQDKLRRHDWRQRAGDISQGKHIWTGILAYLAILRIMHEKLGKRKDLHIRSTRILKFLLIMAITVGKILVMVKRKRYKHAFAVIRRIAPFLMRWRRRHQVKMKERITEFLENSLSQDVFYKIIASWKARILSIQRIMRNWLSRRKAHKVLLTLQWAKVEATLASKAGKALEIPPTSVKFILISDFLKEKLKIHLFDVENWRAKCDSILLDHKNLRYEILDEPIKTPKLPKKPEFPTLLAKEEVMRLMAKANKKKSRWERMAKETKAKNRRKETESEDLK